MQLVSRYVRHMPKTTTCEQFLTGVTSYIRKHYRRSMLPRLTAHPEDRLTCSAVVFSRVCREIWMIGDCQSLTTPLDEHRQPQEPAFYENPKPAEAMLAAMRADEAKRQLSAGKSIDQLLSDDTARPVIIPTMLQTMLQQNQTYSVIDGFHIPREHVPIITLDFRPWEIVLASDGYPFLCPSLQESERRLMEQRQTDPLNIGPRFQATKAFHPDFNSFDDRSYIRFQV